MATRHQQQQIGKVDRLGEPHGQCMTFEMIDGEERLAAREGDALGRHDADHDAADQAGPAGRRDGVEIVEAQLRLGQGRLDQPVDAFEMGAGSDLRHHAAEAAMLGELAVDDVGQDGADRGVACRSPSGRGFHHRHRRLVAARFDTQDAHGLYLASAAHLR